MILLTVFQNGPNFARLSLLKLQCFILTISFFFPLLIWVTSFVYFLLTFGSDSFSQSRHTSVLRPDKSRWPRFISSIICVSRLEDVQVKVCKFVILSHRFSIAALFSQDKSLTTQFSFYKWKQSLSNDNTWWKTRKLEDEIKVSNAVLKTPFLLCD